MTVERRTSDTVARVRRRVLRTLTYLSMVLSCVVVLNIVFH